MPDDQVTISTKSFAFHYVTKTTGEIDGLSFLTQTEDAINDVGNLAQQAVNQSAVSGQKVDQAVSTANTALQNSNTALTTANQARDGVVDLSTEVSQLSQNVSTAVSQSQSAVRTANSANTKSDKAVQDSQTAINTANEAKTTAQQAVLDTSAAEERINQAVSQAQQYATSAQNSSQSASTSMANSAISEQNAERWATWMGSEEDPDQTVDGTDYSAKWWAQHAEDIVNDVVHISAQTLTQEQKNQVWSNIGLSNSSETVSGVIQIATNSDVQTGTNNTKALSPLKAFTNFVSLNAQTLSETIQTQVLTNLGVIDALEELITENGGTVPTSLSENSIQTMSTEGNSDPWADLE